MMDTELHQLRKDSGIDELSICFSSPNNFRKKILADYKANRSGIRKPVCFNIANDYLREQYDAFASNWLEADDFAIGSLDLNSCLSEFYCNLF